MLNEERAGIPGLNEVDLRLKGFKVHALPESTDVPVKAGRRDFYKMGLVNGDMTINCGGQLVEIKGTALFFVNPQVSHALVRRINRTSGYACIFTETFLNGRDLQDSPLFRVGENPVVTVNAEQAAFMTSLFEKMLSVYDGDYLYKSDLVKNYIALIIHEALQIQPAQNTSTFRNGESRLTHLFTEQLEKQFLSSINRPTCADRPMYATGGRLTNRAGSYYTGRQQSDGHSFWSDFLATNYESIWKKWGYIHIHSTLKLTNSPKGTLNPQIQRDEQAGTKN